MSHGVPLVILYAATVSHLNYSSMFGPADSAIRPLLISFHVLKASRSPVFCLVQWKRLYTLLIFEQSWNAYFYISLVCSIQNYHELGRPSLPLRRPHLEAFRQYQSLHCWDFAREVMMPYFVEEFCICLAFVPCRFHSTSTRILWLFCHRTILYPRLVV